MKRSTFLLMMAGMLALVLLLSPLGLDLFRKASFTGMFQSPPSANNVAALLHVEPGLLQDLGRAEVGEGLYTPRNWVFRAGDSLYLVERFLDKGGEYARSYAVVSLGVPLSPQDATQVEALQKAGNVLSKHEVRFYQDGALQESVSYFKTTFESSGETYTSLVTSDGRRINFFHNPQIQNF